MHPSTPNAKMDTMSELSALHESLERAGYFPTHVRDVVDVSLAGEDVVAQLVHLDTTVVNVELPLHVTALALTPTRLVIAHVHHLPPDAVGGAPAAVASTEAIPLRAVNGV